MWFVFPQLRELGRSCMARHYGMASRNEARAFAQHPLLGPRLKACAELLFDVEGSSAHAIMGSPDDLKLRSCMTLFPAVVPEEPVYAQVLSRYFDGEPDERTLALLASAAR